MCSSMALRILSKTVPVKIHVLLGATVPIAERHGIDRVGATVWGISPDINKTLDILRQIVRCCPADVTHQHNVD